MAALLTTIILLLPLASAKPTSKGRTNGVCKEFDLSIEATAPTAVYDLPKVNNDIDTAAWAAWADTWSSPHGPAAILANATVSGTYKIHAKLCTPKSADKGKASTLQIATHGIGYDSRYWDVSLHPEKYSYVHAALEQGYSILSYDRLGVGKSDHPDAYNVTQGPYELEILRQITLLARDGTIYKLANKSHPKAFSGLTEAPSKIIQIGHSYGSFLISALTTHFPALSDAAILTGFVPNEYQAAPKLSTFGFKYANTASFKRPSGYVVGTKQGLQGGFFGGNTSTAFTKEMLDYSDKIKQPVPIAEFASGFALFAPADPAVTTEAFAGPVQYNIPEFDFLICGGDCKGVYNTTTLQQTFYPAAKGVEVHLQENTGHGMVFHENATAGYDATFEFLKKYDL